MQARNVSFTYGPTLVLDDVSLHLQPGTVYGLVGPNGSGKTTLLSILAGILKPNAGTVTGIAAPGLALQVTFFYEHLTGYENLELACRERGISTERIESALEAVDFWRETAVKKVKHYSVGLRQRLSIARSLLTDSPLLLLDEPFAGMDPASMDAFKAAIQADVAARGTTVIISSHLLRDVDDLVDVALVLREGRLREVSVRSEDNGESTRAYLSFADPALTETVFQDFPGHVRSRFLGKIAEVELAKGYTLGELLTFLERKGINWTKAERKKSLEFLYQEQAPHAPFEIRV